MPSAHSFLYVLLSVDIILLIASAFISCFIFSLPMHDFVPATCCQFSLNEIIFSCAIRFLRLRGYDPCLLLTACGHFASRIFPYASHTAYFLMFPVFDLYASHLCYSSPQSVLPSFFFYLLILLLFATSLHERTFTQTLLHCLYHLYQRHDQLYRRYLCP